MAANTSGLQVMDYVEYPGQVTVCEFLDSDNLKSNEQLLNQVLLPFGAQ